MGPLTFAALDMNDCYGSVSKAISISALWGKRGFVAPEKAIQEKNTNLIVSLLLHG